MQLSKSTRYALTATLEMAAAEDGLATVADVARRHRIPVGALSKALQTLVRAGLATGTRGVGGGYRLARPPSAVSVLDVVEVFQALPIGGTLPGAGDDPLGAVPPLLGLAGLLGEVDEYVRATFASVSLQTLARVRARRAPATASPAPQTGKRSSSGPRRTSSRESRSGS